MRKFIIGVASALASYALTRKLTEQPAEEPEEQPKSELEGVVWISAVDDRDDGPLFAEGENVLTWNPYLFDYEDVDEEWTPLYFLVEDFAWDPKDREYRYKLRGVDEWYAESWLVKPEFPFMRKKLLKGESDMHQGFNDWGEDQFNGLGDAAQRQREKKALAEKKQKQVQIDYWLSTLHTAIAENDDKERDTALENLRELTGGDGK